MKKVNENGFAHLQLIIGLVAMIGLISFAVFRVGQSQSNNQELSDTNDPKTVQEIAINQPQQKEVTIPEEEKEVVATPVEKPVVKPVAKPVEKTENKKVEKTWLQMTKVSVVQNGSVLNVVSKLPQPLTGTCTFKLWQDGYDKVYSSASITNSTDCIGQLTLSSLTTYSGWNLYVWFDSSDGKYNASQQQETIVLQQP